MKKIVSASSYFMISQLKLCVSVNKLTHALANMFIFRPWKKGIFYEKNIIV